MPLRPSWDLPHRCLWQSSGLGPLWPGLPGMRAGLFGPRSPRTRERPCPYRSPLHQFSLLHAGFLCLRSENLLAFALGVTILGVCHYTLTVKGSHLATHGALTESKCWSKIWVLFFVEVSLGLGGSSCWYWVGESRCVQLCVPSRAGSCSCGPWAQVCSLHYGGCVSVCARPQALERVEGCMRNDEYLTVAADVV